MRRRTFVRTAGSIGVGGALAGCITKTNTDTETQTEGDDGTTPESDTGTPSPTATPDLSGTLRVATYGSFVDSPSSSPGPWLKKAFENEFADATVEFVTPDNGVNHYIQRKRKGAGIDADLYVGLNVDELIRVDEKLDKRLFAPLSGSLANGDRIVDELRIDPKGRALPYDTGYISLVYDETEVSAPGSFEALTRPEYAGTLLAQNAQTSDTGRAFLLWTIHEMGADGYLDYWQDLLDNEVRVLGSWDKAYSAYSNEERPMVVSYSTDQVYANRYDQPMERHQVGFLNGQGYANPEAAAVFADASEPDLARAFVNFMLTREAQAEIAVRNVQFPSTDYDDLLPDDFDQYAYVPDTPVTHTYEELQGNVDSWVDEWARMVAGN